MAKAKRSTKFVCNSCGYESPKWMGKCPNCGEWNQMVEALEPSKKATRQTFTHTGEASKATRITDVVSELEKRVQTNMPELNRVLGGGVVVGSMVLVGGDPGIGKSTLLLQVSAALTLAQKKVLYISGEESVKQTKLRAERLQVSGDNLYLYAETNLEAIQETINFINPDFVIIDSIQTVYHPDVTSAAGSVSQVRESTAALMRIAKLQNITVFIVGHVTKEGNIAGPRLLEHMVDTVLYFEGERHHAYRILRAVKNRFGSTNEIGIFEMRDVGLVEVKNPSEVFLEERLENASGSTVVASMEGTRPVLVEIQALVSPTMFGNAKRMATGLDYNKVSLIMAVLEKRVGLLLQNQDAYLKAAGGVKLDEPAVDLAIAISIASSYHDRSTNSTDCFIGELGLTGEVRRVARIEERVKEAAKLGFKRIFIPANNRLEIKVPANVSIIAVETIAEALKKALPKS
ncbi:DNA repair protein RadA [Listeria fleischmannii]|jgi:DNA repair protein RadA/Sms|uniref:DNA repair protein RadA n=1 Tax=Listeria fleischmannii TaxID=1069827 RepID=A0A841YHW9_9LIST|nr:DNA repair protein RadA [Listeria fleischmannii]EIA19364.1 DNA repair protein RadA [Listeria fleischmannii subsp. coloradonensis]MBC1399951.1 DNA repair protein RadA [Listeria fleischmannii]MBC1428273.1 DNA repair protein RadA [Listeria fleischmannii]STY36223.1 DNA repair protein RadA [Listeria fleischmannii subsp. coloradonensis]